MGGMMSVLGSILSSLAPNILLPLPRRIQMQQPQQQHNVDNRRIQILVVDQKSWQPIHIHLLEIAEGEDTIYTKDYGPTGFLLPLARCHGLFLSRMRHDRLAIWNPTTSNKKDMIKTIPKSSVPRPPCVKYETPVTYGFGFDPSSDDYKVIRFLRFDFENGTNNFMLRKWLVELYSLKTNSWKQIAYPHDDVAYGSDYVCVFTNNGFCYSRARCDRLVIIPFDLANDNFPPKLIPGPNTLLTRFSIVVFEGSQLGVIAYQWKPFEFELWVWNDKDESWSLRGKWAIGDNSYRPVGKFFNNGVCFLQNYEDDQLVLFDSAQQTLKNLGVHDPFVYVFPHAC